MKANFELTCMLCGKNIKPGNDPITGIPNGLGFQMESGKIYNVCRRCMTERYEEAAEKIKAEEKKLGFDA